LKQSRPTEWWSGRQAESTTEFFHSFLPLIERRDWMRGVLLFFVRQNMASFLFATLFCWGCLTNYPKKYCIPFILSSLSNIVDGSMDEAAVHRYLENTP